LKPELSSSCFFYKVQGLRKSALRDSVKSVDLLRLNLAIEPDLQNFVCFLMESVRCLKGSAFQAAIASVELSQRLRAEGACSGHPFSVCVQLQNHRLFVHWNEKSFEIVQFGDVDPSEIEQLRDHLRKSTESTDSEILIQRNDAMVRHLHETRVRTERELAELELKLQSRQAELQISMHQAETDPLTGLLNRRAFDDRLSQAFRHTMRQKSSPLSLMMLDLDYFKNINDQHGHLYGDAYLVRMALTLRGAIREDVDCAFRFGGDEFAMLIYSDYLTACDRARQILGQMEGRVSIGIAAIDQYTKDDLTLEAFINQADSALYDAKRRGRGRAVVGGCSRADTQFCGPDCSEKGTHA
jgi:diguanylate cyclase (GGDEF)-like protein